jgi:hypothetical protein
MKDHASKNTYFLIIAHFVCDPNLNQGYDKLYYKASELNLSSCDINTVKINNDQD